MDELRPIRFIAELKTLDWAELTPEERERLFNVRNIPDVVMQALQDRRKELHDAVVRLEAEMDQISDFMEGFWEGGEMVPTGELIPKEHGDIIDADAYREEFMQGVYDLCRQDSDNLRANAIIDLYDSAPVLIHRTDSQEVLK